MITTEQLKQLAKVLCPKHDKLWLEAAKGYADNNPPVIADKILLTAAFKLKKKT